MTDDRPTSPVHRSTVLIALAGLIVALSLVAATAGLVWRGGDAPATFTTIHGETVELHGEGLYRYDSIFKAGANRGADLLTLVAGIPLLIVTTMPYRRGSLRGALLFLGSIVWFLYLYGSLALGTSYNNFFLIYVVLFSASLFAFIIAFQSIDRRSLPAHVTSRVPRRGLALFMIVSGLVTLGVWLVEPLTALVQDEPPGLLEHSTTLVTHALDLAIIVPAALLAGYLILRHDPLGYLIAFSLIVLEILLAPMIILQTLFQLSAGVTFTTGEMVGPIGGFLVIALIAIWFLVALLRGIEEAPDSAVSERMPGRERDADRSTLTYA
jgi:hypothetical protein